jgi:ABC-2 type transport system permease protein
MSAPSRAGIIAAIVAKDLRSFAADRLWVVLTPFSMLFAVGAVWLAPGQVNDSWTLGLSPPESAALMTALESEDSDEGFVMVPFESADRLAAAIGGELDDASEAEEQVKLGIAFPEDFAGALRAGEPTTIEVIVNAGTPPALQQAIAGEGREVAFALQAAVRGEDPMANMPVVLPEEGSNILGEDRTADLVPMRDRLRPMMAFMMMMVVCMGLAGLVAAELEHRTVTAMLVTPVRTSDVLAAKTAVGMLIGASQGLLFLLLTRGFGDHPWLSCLLIGLGAALLAPLGLIAGAAGKDFMTTLFLGLALMVPMLVPAFAVLFPGSHPLWVKAMPSYGMIDAMMDVGAYGRGPADVVGHVAASVGWIAVLMGTSLVVLRRRVEAL